jgi:hypothetical protein
VIIKEKRKLVNQFFSGLDHGHPCPPEREARTAFGVTTERLSVLRTLADKDVRDPLPLGMFAIRSA